MPCQLIYQCVARYIFIAALGNPPQLVFSPVPGQWGFWVLLGFLNFAPVTLHFG
jgi:hypothetical protein